MTDTLPVAEQREHGELILGSDGTKYTMPSLPGREDAPCSCCAYPRQRTWTLLPAMMLEQSMPLSLQGTRASPRPLDRPAFRNVSV